MFLLSKNYNNVNVPLNIYLINKSYIILQARNSSNVLILMDRIYKKKTVKCGG